MKKVDFKKTLVRNTEERPKKTTLITDHSNTGSSKVCSASKSEEVVPKLDLNKGNSTDRVKIKQTKFDTPELQSTMKLSKRIDEIVKPRKTKSCSDVDTQKLAVDEKVSRKVNFPYDKAIFKDLIPLSCDRVQPQPVTSARAPLPQKDKEPDLQDFVEPKQPPVYYSLPSVKLEPPHSVVTCDNFRLYRILEINEKS